MPDFSTTPNATKDVTQPYDMFIIGGGVNGCGIARDAAGRGLRVFLAEKDDLAQGTSSASTKLFHGGLRYLEHYEFGLVRHALEERENLLQAMPHISWPMRFILPYTTGLRPAWLIRLGLFIYDHLGKRKLLPATRTVNLHKDPTGSVLKKHYKKAFEFSDCWVHDSRLVVLNARDAKEKGAHIASRCKVIHANADQGLWKITVEDQHTGATQVVSAKTLVNASGPWINQILKNNLAQDSHYRVRLVRGSHIVTKKLFDHDKPYFFQHGDGRIAFAIPYEQYFTLIGTTEVEHNNLDDIQCSKDEIHYLCKLVNEYFDKAIVPEDIIWTYSGVRPLFDEGEGSATSATRDYSLNLQTDGAPLLNIFGGKISTYRLLSESAVEKLREFFPNMKKSWTKKVPLAGGNFSVSQIQELQKKLHAAYPFLKKDWCERLFRCYGKDTNIILGKAKSLDDLGEHFGEGLTASEVKWLQEKEFAQTAEDILWRRTKMGLLLSPEQQQALEKFMKNN